MSASLPPIPELKRILLVDDEVTFATIIALQLERTGRYQVRCLHRGSEVLPVARDWMPDIVLLDFLMPDMDGGEVFKLLKANASLKHIPVIFLTAVATEDSPLEIGVRPGRLTLAKPVSFEKLDHSIQLLLGMDSGLQPSLC